MAIVVDKRVKWAVHVKSIGDDIDVESGCEGFPIGIRDGHHDRCRAGCTLWRGNRQYSVLGIEEDFYVIDDDVRQRPVYHIGCDVADGLRDGFPLHNSSNHWVVEIQPT